MELSLLAQIPFTKAYIYKTKNAKKIDRERCSNCLQNLSAKLLIYIVIGQAGKTQGGAVILSLRLSTEHTQTL